MGIWALFLPLVFAAKTPLVFPKTTFRGGFIVVKLPAPAALKLNGADLPVMPCQESFCAVSGIAIDGTPDVLELKIEKEGAAPETVNISVKTKASKVTKLKVPPSHVEMSPEDKARFEGDRTELQAIFEKSSELALWDGDFVLPGSGKFTSRFGSGRSFNGKMLSTHYGLDLRGNEKTWVLSSNAGKVVLAKELFNPGNMVVVDHGRGIFTTYSHLSSFNVKAGEMVKKGQRLGRAGATGRVSGPHLHWAVRIRDLFVDPEEFLRVFNQSF